MAELTPYPHHYNSYTGLPCNCHWGRPKAQPRLASQAVRQIRNQNQKVFRDDYGKAFLNGLERLADSGFDMESMVPWIASRYKHKDIDVSADYREPTLIWNEPHGYPRLLEGMVPMWMQWMNARQHPLRRGVNIMEKTPAEVNALAAELRTQNAEKAKRDNFFQVYPDNGLHVHTFNPRTARNDYEQDLLDRHNGWQVHQLTNSDHAAAESYALGHCIGSDDQGYARAIDNGEIQAYSLRDESGFPKTTWHFNSDGSLAHVQGRSGYPDEDRRDLISIFNEQAHLDDDNGGSGHEQPLEEDGDALIELPDPQHHGDYLNQFHPQRDLYEQAHEWGNVGEHTEIQEGDPSWPDIYESLREEHNPQTRSDFYNTVLHNQHHTGWDKEVQSYQKLQPNELEPIDHQIAQEWNQAYNRTYDPRGNMIPPEHHWQDGWTNQWDERNLPLFWQNDGMWQTPHPQGGPTQVQGITPRGVFSRSSNILDPVHDTLATLVWDNADQPRPHLKDAHRKWIMREVYTHASHFEPNADAWLTLVLTGSLTTYQYSPTSDCDVSLFIDPFKLPEWDRAKLIALMIEHMDGTKLPGTPFEMQCFVVAKNISTADLYQPGLRSGYDIKRQTWIVPPDKSRTHDVQREQNADYVYALESADKMERLLRYEPDKAVQYWHQIHKRRMRDQRAGKGDFSQANIVYKFLANRGLFPEISQASGEYIA